eukprot:TRINITY_DN23403_c0_g1_i2.p1 TRINITY_DN23403_c0_g1~~TRINITY_DN23403_c0_g1_i2.p1  ORF type:complete len:123 (+),score=10.38 TRINITY_DN23403_c0_g1_i2:89-457(+)
MSCFARLLYKFGCNSENFGDTRGNIGKVRFLSKFDVLKALSDAQSFEEGLLIKMVSFLQGNDQRRPSSPSLSSRQEGQRLLMWTNESLLSHHSELSFVMCCHPPCCLDYRLDNTTHNHFICF